MSEIEILRTDQHCIVGSMRFWELMGNPEFIRLDKNRGVLRSVVYHVKIPPEDIQGFIDARTDELIGMLINKESRLTATLNQSIMLHWICGGLIIGLCVSIWVLALI